MADNNPKIVVLQDYIQARDLLKQGNVEEFLAKKGAELRDLDFEVLFFSARKHKLKDVHFAKSKSVEIERNLKIISNWLKDSIAEITDEKDKEAKQILLNQCKELIADHKGVKKNIEADLAACRFEIFKPLTITGFLGGIPLTLANLAKLFTDDRITILCAAIGGAAIGMSLVHRYHVRTVIESTKAAIVKSPHQFRSLKKSARNSAFATVLTLSVAAKQMSEIEPRHPALSVKGSQAVIAAKI